MEEQTRPRASSTDAFLLARRKFQSGELFEMTSLAAELGVNRVTLHRWVGSRPQLLVEVIWSLAERNLAKNEREAQGDGGARIADVFARFVEDALAHPGMRRLCDEEGELAVRVLTHADGGFQPRIVAACQNVLERAIADGDLDPGAPVRDLAYTLVRIIEAYVYANILLGEPPDAQRARGVLRWLLR